MNRRRHRQHGKGGFTLVEILLATFLGASLIVAAISFILSMGELWGVGVESRLFHKHVRGVSRFLEQTIEKAASRAPQTSTNEDGEEVPADPEAPETPVYWGTWGDKENARKEYLTFEMDESPGLLVWPGDPMPQVVCSLDFEEGEGLFLLWMSRLEKDFEDEEPRRTLISPYLSEIKYYYLDAEDDDPEWEVFDRPETETNGDPMLPQRIELVFEYDGEIVSRHINLPSRINGVPIF